MDFRVKLVHGFYKGGNLIDVGIGSGAFIETRMPLVTYGYDVNPAGRAWLHERGLFRNPYQEQLPAATMWDVLEHIEDFGPLLANVQKWLFVSIPIFTDVAHVQRSKHFRRDEHFWYFTRAGLVRIMRHLYGFELAHADDAETRLGREDIGTFVFRRCGT